MPGTGIARQGNRGALLRDLIEASNNPKDVVIDCCIGSESTGVAALALGWRFVGVELDPDCFTVAPGRIELMA